jgi:hypothetical protein
MQYRRLIAFSLALGAGCNGQTTEGLQPLPEDEAKKHEAPRADGRCSGLRSAPESWVASLEAHDLDARTELRLARDPCGNVALTWAENYLELTLALQNILVRLFSDGGRDWNLYLLGGPWYLSSVSKPTLAVDEFGNIIFLTESWLQVFTAAGQVHQNLPLGGVGPGGTNVVKGSEGWIVEARGFREIRLPSNEIVEAIPVGNTVSTSRTSLLFSLPDTLTWSETADGMGPEKESFYGTTIYVFRRNAAGSSAVFSWSPYDPDLYAEAALLAADGERTFLGSTYYVADPMTLERIECSESVLIDIRDENWKPEPLGFCGAIEAMALVDGSLFSLWSVPVDPLDPEYHPFEAVPILMRHDLDGRETGRFELESIIGRTHQDGTGALDMAITDDGKAAIVGILNGGPWNGRFYLYPSTATVARVPLD